MLFLYDYFLLDSRYSKGGQMINQDLMMASQRNRGVLSKIVGVTIVRLFTFSLNILKHYNLMKVWSRSDDGAERQSKELVSDLQQFHRVRV